MGQTKLHFANIDQAAPFCGTPSKEPRVTYVRSSVDCGNCLRLLNENKATHAGGHYLTTTPATKLEIHVKPRRAPKPRVAFPTRAERKALGSRKLRRDCTKARKHRALPENIHHKLTGR